MAGGIQLSAGGQIQTGRLDTSSVRTGGSADVMSAGGGIMVGPIVVSGITIASGEISLRADADIAVNGDLTSAGVAGGEILVQSDNGRIDTIGSVNSSGYSSAAGSTGGDITLTANGNVTTNSINASGNMTGGDILVQSTNDSISSNNFSIVSNGDFSAVGSTGGDISLTANGNVTPRSINSSGNMIGGDVLVQSTTGHFDSFSVNSFADTGVTGSRGGNVTINTNTTLTIYDIKSNGELSAGNIRLTAGGNVTTRVLDAFSVETGGEVEVMSVAGTITVDDVTSGASRLFSDADHDRQCGRC